MQILNIVTKVEFNETFWFLSKKKLVFDKNWHIFGKQHRIIETVNYLQIIQGDSRIKNWKKLQFLYA